LIVPIKTTNAVHYTYMKETKCRKKWL